MLKNKIESILPLVQKPARYTGGELNSVVKNKEEVDIRFAFCFPDTYEIGMSHLGMKIYTVLLTQGIIFGVSVFSHPIRIWKQLCEKEIFPFSDLKAVMHLLILMLWASPCNMSFLTQMYSICSILHAYPCTALTGEILLMYPL